MKTIWDNTKRQEFLSRLARLQPDTQSQWGKFNCAQMLAHCADGLRMVLGDLATQPKGGPLRFAPLKYLIIYWLPFPKGAPTAPELLARAPNGIAREVADIRELLARLAQSETRASWPEHPAFGKLSTKDWGVLIYKHMDHHLRQFGV